MTKRRHAQAADTSEVREIVRDYLDIQKDYVFDASMFTTEPERSRRVKWVIDNKLNPVDRTLIILYADCLSLRKLGKRLGLSTYPLGKEIRRIKKYILEEYDKLKDTEI